MSECSRCGVTYFGDQHRCQAAQAAVARGFEAAGSETITDQFRPSEELVTRVAGSIEGTQIAVEWIVERSGDLGIRRAIRVMDDGLPPPLNRQERDLSVHEHWEMVAEELGLV